MARTVIGVNAPNAVKRYSASLWLDVSQKAYWGQKFFGKGDTSQMPIQIITDLESDAGEEVKYDLLMEMRMEPIVGDDVLEGKEEAMRFYTDSVYIDQLRCGMNTGGRMTRKRTLHDLRQKAKLSQGNWWARFMDELCFIYISGARGVNENFILKDRFTNISAINPLSPPDAEHHFFGKAATAFDNLAPTDTMSLSAIDRMITRAQTQGGGATDIPVLQPTRWNGGDENYVLVMHPWQEQALRNESGDNTWLSWNKALTTAVGNKSPIFSNSLGMYRNVVLHSHRNVIRFNNAGATQKVSAARALFMGSQAGVIAFGSPGTGNRIQWYEDMDDRGNQVVITSGSIFGVKKATFSINGKKQDMGVFALDTAAAEPVAA